MKLFKKRKKLELHCYQLWRMVGKKGSGICVGVMPAGLPKVSQDKIRVCIGDVLSKDSKRREWLNMTPEEALQIADRLYSVACMVREFAEQKEAER